MPNSTSSLGDVVVCGVVGRRRRRCGGGDDDAI